MVWAQRRLAALGCAVALGLAPREGLAARAIAAQGLAARADALCGAVYTSPLSLCTGCPPTLGGLPCASTSTYTDLTKGPCAYGAPPDNEEVNKTGCPDAPPAGEAWGSQDDECPDAWLWQFTNYTAALNIANHLPSKPTDNCYGTNSSQYACGQCYRLCSTGGQLCTDCPVETPLAGSCVVVKVTNACVDGSPASGSSAGTNDWCGASFSYAQCAADPASCAEGTVAGSSPTNKYGYLAHFDLMNRHGQVALLGWVVGTNSLNVEVTWEAVKCDGSDGLSDGFQGPNNYDNTPCSASAVTSMVDLVDASQPVWP
jgi:hypothetical protein